MKKLPSRTSHLTSPHPHTSDWHLANFFLHKLAIRAKLWLTLYCARRLHTFNIKTSCTWVSYSTTRNHCHLIQTHTVGQNQLTTLFHNEVWNYRLENVSWFLYFNLFLNDFTRIKVYIMAEYMSWSVWVSFRPTCGDVAAYTSTYSLGVSCNMQLIGLS